MQTINLFLDKIKTLLKELNQYTEYTKSSDLSFEAQYKTLSLETQLKLFETMYFCVCSLRNTIISAIDSLQLILQLKSITFPDELRPNSRNLS